MESQGSCTCCPCSSSQKEEEEEYYNQQLQGQDAFWTNIIQQYRNRIKALDKEKGRTEYSIDSMEGTMLPFITYLMIKLSKTRPNLDVNILVNHEIASKTSLSCKCKRDLSEVPNLTELKNFTIQDNDILYMDIITALSEEATSLQHKIDCLQSQEDALIKTKNQVDELFKMSSKSVPDELILNGKLIHGVFDRLTKCNEVLKSELAAEAAKSEALQEEMCAMQAEIDIEQNRFDDLSEQMNYAGANVEIASAVEHSTNNCEETLSNVRLSNDEMNKKYKELKEELFNLTAHTDDLRANYMKRMFEKNENDRHSIANIAIELEADTSGVCKCHDNNGKQ